MSASTAANAARRVGAENSGHTPRQWIPQDMYNNVFLDLRVQHHEQE